MIMMMTNCGILDDTGDWRKTQNTMCDYIQSNLAGHNYKKHKLIQCNLKTKLCQAQVKSSSFWEIMPPV